jgi:hypothetical protein
MELLNTTSSRQWLSKHSILLRAEQLCRAAPTPVPRRSSSHRLTLGGQPINRCCIAALVVFQVTAPDRCGTFPSVGSAIMAMAAMLPLYASASGARAMRRSALNMTATGSAPSPSVRIIRSIPSDSRLGLWDCQARNLPVSRGEADEP